MNGWHFHDAQGRYLDEARFLIANWSIVSSRSVGENLVERVYERDRQQTSRLFRENGRNHPVVPDFARLSLEYVLPQGANQALFIPNVAWITDKSNVAESDIFGWRIHKEGIDKFFSGFEPVLKFFEQQTAGEPIIIVIDSGYYVMIDAMERLGYGRPNKLPLR